MLIPLFTAIALSEKESFHSLFSSTLLAGLIGGSLMLGFRSIKSVRTARLTILLPVCGVIALAIVSGLPFFFLLPDQGLWPAIYEGMSLITTNGSSAYEGSFDNLIAISLWRALVAWIGGYFAICVALSFLTALNIGGLQLHKSPLPFADSDIGYPRLLSTAKTLLPVYTLVTGLCCILLWISGLTAFEALTLGMATISTTGLFDSYGDGLTSIWTQFILIIFMLFSILNWDFHHLRMQKRSFRVGKDPEFSGVIMLVAITVILLSLFSDTISIQSLWHSLFAVVSAVSTMGIMPENYLDGTEFHLTAGILLMLTAAVGGSVIGTGGGLKQLRAIIIYRTGRAELDRLAHPHGVSGISVGEVEVQKRDIEAIWLLLGSFVLVLVGGSLALAVLGVHFQDALSMSFTALTLSGPLITVADPLFGGFVGLRDADYFILTVLMMVGRVETSLLLALFAKSLWRG
jgi:trk/ktr system potassium uptake protein